MDQVRLALERAEAMHTQSVDGFESDFILQMLREQEGASWHPHERPRKRKVWRTLTNQKRAK